MRTATSLRAACFLLPALVLGCGTGRAGAPAVAAPADAFLAGLARHCGQAFAGRIVANEPAAPDDPFAGKDLVMHVRECGAGEVKVPSATRQEFPVDAFSIALFERAGLAASVTNTWAMEVEPGRRFLYELSRPGGRLFQVEFDLSAPVAPPPPPWGHE